MCSHLYVTRGKGLMVCTHLTSDDEDAHSGFSTLNTHDQHLQAAGPCNDFTYTVKTLITGFAGAKVLTAPRTHRHWYVAAQ